MEGDKPYKYIYTVRKLLKTKGNKLVERVIKQGSDVEGNREAPKLLQSIIVSVRREVNVNFCVKWQNSFVQMFML